MRQAPQVGGRVDLQHGAQGRVGEEGVAVGGDLPDRVDLDASVVLVNNARPVMEAAVPEGGRDTWAPLHVP